MDLNILSLLPTSSASWTYMLLLLTVMETLLKLLAFAAVAIIFSMMLVTC